MQPSSLPNSVVNIVNPPIAPDPAGLTSALNLLATANIFRDMSGIQQVGSPLNTLIQANAAGRPSVTSQPTSTDGGSPNTGSTSRGGSTTPQAPARPTPQEQHDQMQVNRSAVANGDLTPEQGSNLNRQYLENAQRPVGQPTTETTRTTPTSLRRQSIISRFLFADFDNNQSALKEEHRTALDLLQINLNNSLPSTRIELFEGHAKTGEDNAQGLSRQRAEAVRDYLASHGLPESRYASNLQGTGSANPIRENARSTNIEVNKSVVLQISSTLEVMTPSQLPAFSGTGSTDWDLRLTLVSASGHIFVSEIKNVRRGQIRAVVLVGGGIPSMEYIESDSFRTQLQQQTLPRHNLLTGTSFPWVRFRCTREIDFSDFDGTRVLLQGDPQLEYFIGTSHVQISFPDLEPQAAHWIDFGEIAFHNTTKAGFNCIDYVGVCKEIGETWLS